MNFYLSKNIETGKIQLLCSGMKIIMASNGRTQGDDVILYDLNYHKYLLDQDFDTLCGMEDMEELTKYLDELYCRVDKEYKHKQFKKTKADLLRLLAED